MKKLTMVLGAMLLAASLQAAESALFKKLEPLAGTWEATVKGQKVRTVITYASHGSVLIENMMPESENMVNLIHAAGDKVMITHYCAGGNQPRYRASRFDGNKVDFKFFDGTNLGKEFMSGVSMTLVDEDHFVEEWRVTKDGKESPDVRFEYSRVK